MSELVAHSGLTKQYVRRILRCAALSSQITDAILEGRHPVNLTVATLADSLSNDWHEQWL
jgi:hypothetical protein